MFPPTYNRTILIALHGSWNRTPKIGYGIKAVRVDPNGTTLGLSNFATGWLQGQNAWGEFCDFSCNL